MLLLLTQLSPQSLVQAAAFPTFLDTFCIYLLCQVLQMKGFSHSAKDRWVVIAPRFTPPSQRGAAVGVVRVMMLVYRNAAEAEPRTKLWLDGASIFRSGQEAVLVRSSCSHHLQYQAAILAHIVCDSLV